MTFGKLAEMLRSAGMTLVVLLLAVLGASCVGLLDLDDHQAAADALCDQLEACFGAEFYPECKAHNEPRVTGASAAEREAWLTAFNDTHCLETCESARSCLDESPLCGPSGQACSQVEQCCGFTKGAGTCLDGGCCKPDGIACDGGGECCNGDCSSPPGETETFCGGFMCLDAGAACTDHFECCTEICIGGQCSDTTCLPIGSDCALNVECCDGACEAGRCVEPSCISDGDPCTSEDMCCNDFCYTSVKGDSVCSSGPCLPKDTPCLPEANECCSGRCDPDAQFCVELCLRPHEACSADGECCIGACDPNTDACECYSEGTPCEEASDCCTENCQGGTCGGIICPDPGTPCDPDDNDCCPIPIDAFSSCQMDTRAGNGAFGCCDLPTCEHSVCVPGGGPLDPACGCPECGTDGMSTSARCIQDICMALPHCCCFAWDSQCVARAKDMCAADCSVIGMPPGSGF